MKHFEVVAAIIEYQGKILCMQRNAGKYDYVSYKFEFPGGKIEDGESKTAALIRELKEEMDFQINITENDFLMTTTHEYPDFIITMHCYLCHSNTDLFVRKEHISHKWCLPSELDKLDWAPADLPVVKKVMELSKE